MDDALGFCERRHRKALPARELIGKRAPRDLVATGAKKMLDGDTIVVDTVVATSSAACSGLFRPCASAETLGLRR